MANDKMFVVHRFEGAGEPKTKVGIPDGKWVLPIGTRHFREESWDPDGTLQECQEEETRYSLIGVREEAIEKIVVDRGRTSKQDRGYSLVSGHSTVWLVCDQPFGVIIENRENGDRAGGLWFACARQVHKDELGRRPQITRPRFVREQLRARDRRRGKHGWARLSDVATLANMPSNEMLARFWDFTHSESPRLDLIVAQNDQELRQVALTEGVVRVLEPENLQPVLSSHEEYVWIRQGFALTILYLLHLGYTPDLPARVETAVVHP